MKHSRHETHLLGQSLGMQPPRKLSMPPCQLRFRAGLGAALLVAACTTPSDRDAATRSQALNGSAVGRAAPMLADGTLARLSASAGGLTPRTIKPVVKPLGLDPKPVNVMVELAGDPITRVQARSPARKLTTLERRQLRDDLVVRQASVRRSLEGLGATVLREYQNAYNGLAIRIPRRQVALVRGLPGVAKVHPLHPKKPTATNAVPFLATPAAWGSRVAGFHGESIKVAIIDSGIDYTHANFAGPGTPEAYQAARAGGALPADPSLFGPNALRIKGGIDLVGDAYDAASDDPAALVPRPDLNPLDCSGHGSHVAGIAGGAGVTPDGHTYSGPYDLATYSAAFAIAPGVAPRADLYAVRVLGCDGATDVVVDGIEWAVDNDMDVINMSLGGAFGAVDDPDAVAATNAIRSGVVVVATAGNDGQNVYLAGSPGNADGVLSVAAMDAIPSFPGATFALDGVSLDVENANGAVFADATPYRVAVLGSPAAIGLGCDASEYRGPDIAGALVVTRRGECDRVTRASLGQQAGAAAVVMVNGQADGGYPPFEGEIPGVTIPFFGARFEDAPLLVAATALVASPSTLANPGYLAPATFTSGGPRFGDSALKPNLIAPGVSIVSTNVGTGKGGVAFSGTSMAAPSVAGLAALTKQAHPSWLAGDIAAALSNTADPTALVGYQTRVSGAGVPTAAAAFGTQAVATADASPAVSFGFVELGGDVSLSKELAIDNRSDKPMTFDVTVPLSLVGGVEHTVSLPAQVSLAPAERVQLPLHVELAAGAATDPRVFSDFSGIIQLTPAEPGTNQGITLRVPYYGVVRPEARLLASLAAPGQGNSTAVTLSNSGAALAGTAELFTWGIEGQEDAIGCNDVRAVGVQSTVVDEDRALIFAIAGFRRCSNAAANEYDIQITTESGGEYLIIGADRGALETGELSGELATLIVNIATDESVLLPALAATDSSVVYLVALASQLGLTPEQPRFSYYTETFSGADTGDDPASETASFNAYASALVGQGQASNVAPDAVATLRVSVDPKESALTPPRGVMVVFEANAPGPAQASLLPLSALPVLPVTESSE